MKRKIFLIILVEKREYINLSKVPHRLLSFLPFPFSPFFFLLLPKSSQINFLEPQVCLPLMNSLDFRPKRGRRENFPWIVFHCLKDAIRLFFSFHSHSYLRIMFRKDDSLTENAARALDELWEGSCGSLALISNFPSISPGWLQNIEIYGENCLKPKTFCKFKSRFWTRLNTFYVKISWETSLRLILCLKESEL
jgi:hypothetical protein